VSEQKIGETHHLSPRGTQKGQRKKTIASSMMQSTRPEKPGTVKDPG
jgi:hypothetical protein